MIIFNQKRIITIFLMVFVSLFAFSFKIANNNMLNKEITTETVALPVTNRVIVIDAGHGTPDEGAESNNGVTEAEINLRIALKLQNLLEQSGAKVILTRSNETAIYDIDKKTLREKKVSDIHNRVKIGNESSADIFVSIHLNKIPQNQYWGWQCFYNQNEKSKILAENLQNNLNEAIQKENKRIAMNIVECGFLSNEEEEKRLQEDDYQNRLAWGIYNGIMDYFN